MTRKSVLLCSSPFGALVLLVFAAACFPEYANNELACPPYEDFAPVSTLLERRCGTLDCHGQAARPLRLYGQYGLRLNPTNDADPTLYAGADERPTTEVERKANYYAVCGLEPEKLTQFIGGEVEATELTMVRKPRLTEKHKGGRIWNQGKAPDRCLTTWLEADYEAGAMDAADCVTAIQE